MIPKFRAYLKRDNNIVDVQEINYKYEEIVWEDGRYTEVEDFKDVYIMESTGFYDKYNEIPIYESDFVEIRTVRGSYYDSGIIKKKKGSFYIETGNKSIMLLSDFYFKGYTDNLELHVVGNIYDTEEGN